MVETTIQPNRPFRKAMPWILGMIISALILGTLAATVGFQYSGSDDTPILHAFMGYDGGVPARYSFILHTVFSWLLYGLSTLFPGIAWFSILQLFFLWFSGAVIVKSLAQRARISALPLWSGALGGTAFLLAFFLFHFRFISYTTTGGLLGAAAIAQLFSVDYAHGTPSQTLRGLLFSVVLLLCTYCLRQVGVLPHLAFWGLSLLLIGWLYFAPLAKASDSKSPKPLLIALLVCALAFGALEGIRAIETKALGLEDYLKWNKARVNLFDYTNFYENTDEETLAEVGWTPAQFKLVANWFFMDETITTETFETLYAAQMEGVDLSFPGKVQSALQVLQSFWRSTASSYPLYALLGLLALSAILLPLLVPEQRKILSLAALGGTGLCALMLFYLAYEGRLPVRAAMTVLLPAGVFFTSLFLMAIKSPQGKTCRLPLLSGALALCMVALAALNIASTFPRVFYSTMDEETQYRAETIPVDLDTFALENPDMLIIYDLSLVADNRLFPDTSNGVPDNLIFWGGWPAHSPSWYYQLEKFGIDGKTMNGEDFLRENVLVASTDGQPWESLLTYVAESTGMDIDWDFYEECGFVGFYQLYEY